MQGGSECVRCGTPAAASSVHTAVRAPSLHQSLKLMSIPRGVCVCVSEREREEYVCLCEVVLLSPAQPTVALHQRIAVAAGLTAPLT